MSTIFSLPGKLGDALHQWAVAFWWAKERNQRFGLWLDENMLKPLVPLFEAQPCCESVELKAGITSYHLGGQPWDFGLKTDDYQGMTVHHLGFRQFPQVQITREVISQVPQVGLSVTPRELAETPTLVIPEPLAPANRVLLHGTFLAPNGGSPGFWRFLADVREDLEENFDEVCFIGTPAETARAREVYPDWQAFDDGGDFLVLARYMAASRLVIGSGSSGVALAGQLKIPSIRVHDPIGEAPKVIWSNLGDRQWNDTERGLRGQWPQIREQFLTPVAQGLA